MRGWPALLAVILAACSHRPPPVPVTPTPHYVVGDAYRLGDTWSYPQERFGYVATGLAERMPNRTGLTADGEAFDQTAMAGSHRTLQLPAIVDVTNLDNGRQIRIRLDDRGPATPGRILGLTTRAADLLGLPDGPAPVRIELDSDASQALRDRLGGGPHGITAAPVAAVSEEALPAPGQAPIGRPKPARVAAVDQPAEDRTLARLPDTVRTVPVQPGQLWIRVGEFTQARYADALRHKIDVPAEVRREGAGRGPSFVVLAGPFATAASADAGLDRIRASGVTDATIVVE